MSYLRPAHDTQNIAAQEYAVGTQLAFTQSAPGALVMVPFEDGAVLGAQFVMAPQPAADPGFPGETTIVGTNQGTTALNDRGWSAVGELNAAVGVASGAHGKVVNVRVVACAGWGIAARQIAHGVADPLGVPALVQTIGNGRVTVQSVSHQVNVEEDGGPIAVPAADPPLPAGFQPGAGAQPGAPFPQPVAPGGEPEVPVQPGEPVEPDQPGGEEGEPDEPIDPQPGAPDPGEPGEPDVPGGEPAVPEPIEPGPEGPDGE